MGIVEIVKATRDFVHMVVLQLGLHITLGHNNSNQTTHFEWNANVISNINVNCYDSMILNF